MRRFIHGASAGILARGHAFVQNLRNGFSTLTATVPRYVAPDDRVVAADQGNLAPPATPIRRTFPK